MIKCWNITIPELSGDTPRRAYVYIPDSFRRNPNLRYPVLYMFDGHNLFFDSHATYGKSWGLLDYMKKSRTQLMIAAVECSHDPDNGRLHEYSPFSCYVPELNDRLQGKGKITMDWFVNTFKPFIDEHCPTIPDRRHTFIAGSSMGGLMSLYAVTRYNRYFSRCAALSPSVWFGRNKLERLLRTAPVKKDTMIYLDYGSNELNNHAESADGFSAVTAILLRRRINSTIRIIPNGDHTEASWEKQIPLFMDALLYDLK